MRQLGRGQAVTFLIPEEIETQIRQSLTEHRERRVSVLDVLDWSIRETWKDIRRSIPLWAMQGRNFARQRRIWNEVPIHIGSSMDQHIAERFLEDEAHSLQERYEPNRSFVDGLHGAADDDILFGIQQRCHQFSDLEDTPATLQQEQERELSPEVEQEREIERAPPAKPVEHRLHHDVVHFVRTGRIKAKNSDWGFDWAFQSLTETSAAKEMDISRIASRLLVTKDFARTVKPVNFSKDRMDAFQRDVQWVLTDRSAGQEITKMVILSPYEADKLLPEIEQSKFVVMHIFSPRQNSAFEPLDHLTLYRIPSSAPLLTIPQRLRIELCIFSGQLYFQSYQEYGDACDFLCLPHNAEDSWTQQDGSTYLSHHQDSRPQCTIFRESPVKFLRNLFENIRRHGDGISRTHMGRVLEGELLSKEDFED
jgi:hypothetical protein